MQIYRKKSGFVPLLVNLNPHWERSSDELPPELQVLVKERYVQFKWDDIRPDQRLEIAEQQDQGDPAHEPVLHAALAGFEDEIQAKIASARKRDDPRTELELRELGDQLAKIVRGDRNELGRQIQRLRSEAVARPATRTHLSEKMTFMIQAADKFWANAIRDDRETHPTNADVAKWLQKRSAKFSESLSIKAATIIRPEWAPTGRKPD